MTEQVISQSELHTVQASIQIYLNHGNGLYHAYTVKTGYIKCESAEDLANNAQELSNQLKAAFGQLCELIDKKVVSVSCFDDAGLIYSAIEVDNFDTPVNSCLRSANLPLVSVDKIKELQINDNTKSKANGEIDKVCNTVPAHNVGDVPHFSSNGQLRSADDSGSCDNNGLFIQTDETQPLESIAKTLEDNAQDMDEYNDITASNPKRKIRARKSKSDTEQSDS